jgi:hypothetical protein
MIQNRLNKQSTQTNYIGKSNTHFVVNIQRLNKNMFSDACCTSGILEKKPELDYALFKAYEVVKRELCNNNILDHLDFQAKRGYNFVRYVLNFDTKTKKYLSNVVTITTPGAFEYKIVKTQFFLDKTIRSIFFEKIAYWYKAKFDLNVEFKATQIKNNIWNCSVCIQNPVLSNSTEDAIDPNDEEAPNDEEECKKEEAPTETCQDVKVVIKLDEKTTDKISEKQESSN